MNPDNGDEAEDWFAKFEREAREAAQKREAENPTAPDPTAADPTTQYPPAQYPPVQTPPTPVFPPQASPPVQPPPLVAPPQPAPSWDQPTQAMGRIEPEPTQAMSAQPEAPTQALVPAPLRPPAGAADSALDSLFGDDRFREYEGVGPDPNEAPFANRGKSKELVTVPGGDGSPPPPRHLGTPQKVLIGVGGGLLATLVLIALFLLGTRLPDLLGPAPAVATPTPTPTPTITALPIGPVAAGATYDWDELLGGECLDPYVDAWQEEYSVVDCAAPHPAQMVYRAWFAESVAGAAFPGPEALQAQISLLCSVPGVVDLAAAGLYADVQMQGAYPVTAEQWDADPSYYCFVSRASGEPLTGSVAIPQVPAEPAQPAPAP